MRLQDATKIWFKQRQASFCLARCEIDQNRIWSLEFFSFSNLGFLDFAEKTSICQFFCDRFQFLFSVKFLMFCSCSFSNVLPTFFDVQVSGPDFSSKFPRWLLKLLRNCSSYWYIYWYLPQNFFLCWRGAQLWKAKIVSVSVVFRYHFYVIPFCWFTRKIMSEKASSPFSLAFSPVNCKVLFKESTELRQNSQYHAMSLSCWCSSFLMFSPLAWNQFSQFSHSTPSLLFSEFCTFFRWFLCCLFYSTVFNFFLFLRSNASKY